MPWSQILTIFSLISEYLLSNVDTQTQNQIESTHISSADDLIVIQEHNDKVKVYLALFPL